MRSLTPLDFFLSVTMTTAVAGPPAPSPAAVRPLVERQARSWETGDEAEFTGTLHPDAGFAYAGKRLTVAGAIKTFCDWKRDFRETKIHAGRVVIAGAQFAVEYTFATTNVASGRRTAAGTVAVGEVRDGKIIVWKKYLDGRVSRRQAAGELPVAEMGGTVSVAEYPGEPRALSKLWTR